VDDRGEVEVLEALQDRVEVRALEVDGDAVGRRGVLADPVEVLEALDPVGARRRDLQRRVQVIGEAGERAVRS